MIKYVTRGLNLMAFLQSGMPKYFDFQSMHKNNLILLSINKSIAFLSLLDIINPSFINFLYPILVDQIKKGIPSMSEGMPIF